ncbi:MAG: hypothetical protein GX081_11955 [Firmicutes bacterium]|nr:hypothetical protein [Bacillota bacterium]
MTDTGSKVDYCVWYRPDEKENFELLKRVDGKTTSCIHEFANREKKYWYTVSAVNTRGIHSDKCTPISFIASEAIPLPPAAPTWGPSPLKTGANDGGSDSCWIELEWNEVDTRQDGTPLENLLYYKIYKVSTGDNGTKVRSSVAQVAAGNNIYRLNNLTRGAKYTFVVTAVDRWGNESEQSEERTIIAGGPIPKAPELLSVQAIDEQIVKVVFSAVTENTEESGGGSATITEYVIYRALNAPLNFIEIGRIKAQYPQPESYSFTDNTTVRGDNYYYNVRAVDSDFIYSEYSNHMGIKIGDYTPPSTPTWVSIHTQINSDYSIDNILTFNCGQEPDLHGINVYTRLASTAENWTLIGVVQRQEENPYTFVHRNLSNKETYQYRLVAFDLVGNSSSSSEVGSVVAGNLYPPKAPVVTGEGFYSYELNQACVRLTWPEVTENDNPSGSEPVVGLAGYRIYRSHEENYNYKLVTTVSNNGEKVFVDQGLYNGISYYYRVTAYNVFGQESEYCQVEVVAGDPTPPLRPEVTMTPIFNPASPSLVTVELRITSEDNPSHYKIYRSTNGVTWFLENTIPRAEGITTYSYEMAYGNTAFCRVAAISIPGVEGPYFELNQRVLDTVAPHDIPAPAVTFSQTADGDFISAISWSYTPPEDFARYEILSEQYNPATVATITNKDDNVYYINGLQAGVEYSFAVVCVDVYGLRSNPNWTSATPVDTTIPKAPGSVTATGGIRCVWIEWEPVTKNTNGTVCNDLGYYIIEIANNEEFTDPISVTVPGSTTSYTFNISDTSSTWFFRIKAKDWYNNVSEWAVSNGAKAEKVEL